MEQIEIKGKAYSVKTVLTKNRTAIAGLKGNAIVISIPSRWSSKDKAETFESLLRRSVRSIEKGRWTVEGSKKLVFSHGQRLDAMGRRFQVTFRRGERLRSRLDGDRIEVVLPGDDGHERGSELAKRQIVKALMPDIRARISHFNDRHFHADVKRINIRDNLTLWGSCSPDNTTISLNFRLLFMPQPVLDYVIVHELAHTRYRSHGKRFWGLVARVLPGFEEHRAWLKKNGWSIFSTPQKTGQLTLMDFPGDVDDLSV